ncbi:MAG: hypothetical protein LBU17_12720 [Treponema sp.]|jgi:hypothetical protein|nr:hypothetical protein [Treponema sp.]
MKNFIFVFDHLAFGIPAACVAEFVQAPVVLDTLIEADSALGDIFCSIPHFFRKAAVAAPHGIVLKSLPYPEAVIEALHRYAGGKFHRILLLTTPIEREIEVPDETILQLPTFLSLPGKLPFLTGVSFSDTGMTAYLDPVLLVSRIIRDAGGGP